MRIHFRRILNFFNGFVFLDKFSDFKVPSEDVEPKNFNTILLGILLNLKKVAYSCNCIIRFITTNQTNTDMRNIGTKLLALFLVVALLPAIADSQDLESFEENVTEFTLDNGLKFIVVERPVAPVVSFVTHVDVGGANEPIGHTGMAHIFEHMAFKGTDYIGTTNWEEEKKVIEELDQVYQQWLQESYSPSPDSVRLEQLWTQFTELQEEAEEYVVNNEYSQIIDRNGGTGMNAGTGADLTIYYYSLPENRMELWFSLESDRFKNPVFREFYKEKEVVREERRSRVDSQPGYRMEF
jgi:hypothetical protein